jgi:hypothetical protein
MTDPRAEVTKATAELNGDQEQAGYTHVAIHIEVWKAAIDALSTMPYSHVEKIIPALQAGKPVSLMGVE